MSCHLRRRPWPDLEWKKTETMLAPCRSCKCKKKKFNSPSRLIGTNILSLKHGNLTLFVTIMLFSKASFINRASLAGSFFSPHLTHLVGAPCPMFMTSSFQVPAGFSPQKWTERKGHSSKVVAKVSRGRGKRRMDLYVGGERQVANNCGEN